jgi:predicted GTPase
MVEKVVIMGAAGRDFHNFNVYFKDNKRYNVIAFTAAQIPDIAGRLYPPELSGNLYPEGIPIHPEGELAGLIRKHEVDLVAFSYSDVPHVEVMHKASLAMAEGADFILIGAPYTMLKSKKPVVAVCAVRTGCGKSQTTRRVCEIVEDFEKHQCTIEEREEYEPLVEQGIVVYAGIDYGQILKAAEKEADVVIWDGGNNDTPFYKPDLHIVLFDPHRAGHELLYYPGETNMIMADIAIINKVDSAPAQKVWQVRKNIEKYAPAAEIVLAESSLVVKNPEMIQGKRVLVIEDGPTLTHGEMPFGAGVVAAETFKAAEIVDPAMGYTPDQISDLEKTIDKADCDLVVFATPIHLPLVLKIQKPTLRVRYEYQDHGSPTLAQLISARLK